MDLVVGQPVLASPNFSGDLTYKGLFDILLTTSDNARCVDCKSGQSTHVSVFFAVFLCENCAFTHRNELTMHKSYVKKLGDTFDDYQIRFFQVENIGNANFQLFLEKYKIESLRISEKYQTRATKHYKQFLMAQVEDRDFAKKAPNERL